MCMVLRGKDEVTESEVCVLGEVERVGEADSRGLLLDCCASVPPELLTMQLRSFYTLFPTSITLGRTDADMEVQQ